MLLHSQSLPLKEKGHVSYHLWGPVAPPHFIWLRCAAGRAAARNTRLHSCGRVLLRLPEAAVIQLLGWIGSALIVLSLTLRRQMPFRVVNLAAAGVLLMFNLAIGLWSMVFLNATILIVNYCQIRRLRQRSLARSGRWAPSGLPAPPTEGWYTRHRGVATH